ncbi:MAG: serine/threonine protein kinase, partial [Myxococcales bacterium]|nr:serine/threonine protein kinase [Myxococcales bacterium]
MESERGICPQCELPGSVGDPCSERACALRHVHCIPALYHDEIRKQPHEFRDPQIGLVIDSHLIVGKLGEGGFGSVYLVLQLPIMMKAALKLMNLKLSKDPVVIQKLIKKFETEARSLAQLDHPNIVRLVRYGHLHDRPYLVMEYVANARSLRDEVLHRIAEGRGFDLETLGALLDQVLSALQRAHALQIVHRDIKPDNIMLQRVDERFFVRVLDFGLSKFTAESELTSIIAGTPVYMAPEQIVQRNLGPWTDLYAVAAMTFELLTGKRPFTGATSQEIYQKKLDVRYDPCTMLPTQYRIPRLVEFFSKSMAQKPELRFQDVPSFRSALQSIFSELAEREQPLEPATDLGELNSQEDSGSSDTGVAQTTPGHPGARAEVRVDEATPSPSMSGLPQLAARPARSRSVELAKPLSSNVPTSADATTSVSTEISGGAPTRA